MSVHETPCPSLTEHAARALSEDDERAEHLWAFVLRVEREWEAEQADPITAAKACADLNAVMGAPWLDLIDDARPDPRGVMDGAVESELRAAWGDR